MTCLMILHSHPLSDILKKGIIPNTVDLYKNNPTTLYVPAHYNTNITVTQLVSS